MKYFTAGQKTLRWPEPLFIQRECGRGPEQRSDDLESSEILVYSCFNAYWLQEVALFLHPEAYPSVGWKLHALGNIISNFNWNYPTPLQAPAEVWTSGAVKRHSDSDLVPSDMPVCEVSQEAISFSFTSWRTRACKLEARTCKKTNSDVLGWNQHFQMCGKSVYMSGWQKTDLSSMAGGPAPADCDGGCVAKTDFDVWAA